MTRIEAIMKKFLPYADTLATIAAICVWIFLHNFTAGMLLWLLGESFRIQLNQIKILEKLK